MGIRLYTVFEKGKYDSRIETFGKAGGSSLGGMLARIECLLRLWPHTCDPEQMLRPVATFEIRFGENVNPWTSAIIFSATRTPGGARDDLCQIETERALAFPPDKLEEVVEELFQKYKHSIRTLAGKTITLQQKVV